MKKDITTEIASNLETTIQSAGKTAPVAQRRISNIQWIENLPRKGLSYGKKEKQLLIHTTADEEMIFIHYPGKESVGQKPWDFRPELYYKKNNNRHESMSFGSIWATIFETASSLTQKDRKDVLRVLAALFYRMAFMLDHIQGDNTFNTKERDVLYKGSEPKFSRERKVKLPALFKWQSPQGLLPYLNNACPRWGNMSLEAFLFYNELLVWNEDCKYYYRNYRIRTDEIWISKTGRVNTLLTHIRILGYMLGEVALSDVFDGFAKQRGISPASNAEVIRVCGGLVKAK